MGNHAWVRSEARIQAAVRTMHSGPDTGPDPRDWRIARPAHQRFCAVNYKRVITRLCFVWRVVFAQTCAVRPGAHDEWVGSVFVWLPVTVEGGAGSERLIFSDNGIRNK